MVQPDAAVPSPSSGDKNARGFKTVTKASSQNKAVEGIHGTDGGARLRSHRVDYAGAGHEVVDNPQLVAPTSSAGVSKSGVTSDRREQGDGVRDVGVVCDARVAVRQIDLKLLVRRRSNANATQQQLYALSKELNNSPVSMQTKDIFTKLMSYPPVLRLSVNIRNLLVELSLKPVRNWVEALAPDEQAALIALERNCFGAELMEVAHGLLNIHERWSVMKSTAKSFREARPLGGLCIDEKPLDNILR